MVKASGRNLLFCLRVHHNESGISVDQDSGVMSTISPRRASVALLIMKVSMPIALDFVLRINPPLTANVPLMSSPVTLKSQNLHSIFCVMRAK